jgi:hypothetical protein
VTVWSLLAEEFAVGYSVGIVVESSDFDFDEFSSGRLSIGCW